MLTGIAAFVQYKNGFFDDSAFGGNKDGAYGAILSILPAGLNYGLFEDALTTALLIAVPVVGKIYWEQAGREVSLLFKNIPACWSFFFTVLLMILVSLAGPKLNPKAFDIDSSMFKLKPATVVMITIIILMVVALYAKFWQLIFLSII